MSEGEFEKRLKRIAELAKAQKEGPFDPRSDAMMALELLETMALLLIEEASARAGRPTKPVL